MTTQINSRQCIILLIISIFALKFQGLFSLLSHNVGRDGWLFILFFLVFDLLLLLLVIRVLKLFPNKTLYDFLCESYGKVFAKIVFLCFAVYFIFKAIIPYKGINDLFGNVLFEFLPWSVFSLFLVFTVLFMVGKKLRGIGRVAELFFGVIVVGIIGCLLLSVFAPDYSRLLPILDNGLGAFVTTAVKYNMWFGDFLLLFLMMGKISSKLEYKKVLSWYAISGIVVAVFLAIFYSLYENLAVYQYQGLASITQFALLGLDIGKIDKILVLFSFVSTVIAIALYIYFSSTCLAKIFGIKRNVWFTIFCLVVIYILDVYVSGDVSVIIKFFENYLGYFGVVVHVGFTLLFYITAEIRAKIKLKNMEAKNDSIF